MAKKINIVFASDDNYAQHIAVVISSIMNNTKSGIHFFVINDNISLNKMEKLQATATFFGADIDFIDVQTEKFKNVYLSGHVSKAAYFRLALAELLPATVERAIYLDVDLLVYDDILKLWQHDLRNLPVGAIVDFGIMASKRLCKQKEMVIGLEQGEKYFNSGVLLLDLVKWRTENYTKHILELINNNSFPHHDQDALNKFFRRNWEAIDLRWNVIPPVFNLFPKILLKNKFRQEAIAAKKYPAIIHYAGRYKPWEFTEHKGFNDSYYKYLQETAFADAVMPQPGKNMQGKSILRQLVRLKIADFWVKLL